MYSASRSTDDRFSTTALSRVMGLGSIRLAEQTFHQDQSEDVSGLSATLQKGTGDTKAAHDNTFGPDRKTSPYTSHPLDPPPSTSFSYFASSLNRPPTSHSPSSSGASTSTVSAPSSILGGDPRYLGLLRSSVPAHPLDTRTPLTSNSLHADHRSSSTSHTTMAYLPSSSTPSSSPPSILMSSTAYGEITAIINKWTRNAKQNIASLSSNVSTSSSLSSSSVTSQPPSTTTTLSSLPYDSASPMLTSPVSSVSSQFVPSTSSLSASSTSLSSSSSLSSSLLSTRPSVSLTSPLSPLPDWIHQAVEDAKMKSLAYRIYNDIESKHHQQQQQQLKQPENQHQHQQQQQPQSSTPTPSPRHTAPASAVDDQAIYGPFDVPYAYGDKQIGSEDKQIGYGDKQVGKIEGDGGAEGERGIEGRARVRLSTNIEESSQDPMIPIVKVSSQYTSINNTDTNDYIGTIDTIDDAHNTDTTTNSNNSNGKDDEGEVSALILNHTKDNSITPVTVTNTNNTTYVNNTTSSIITMASTIHNDRGSDSDNIFSNNNSNNNNNNNNNTSVQKGTNGKPYNRQGIKGGNNNTNNNDNRSSDVDKNNKNNIINPTNIQGRRRWKESGIYRPSISITPDKHTPYKQTPDKGTSSKGTSSKGTPDKQTSNKGTPYRQTPDKGTPDEPNSITPNRVTADKRTSDKGTPTPLDNTTNNNTSRGTTTIPQHKSTSLAITPRRSTLIPTKGTVSDGDIVYMRQRNNNNSNRNNTYSNIDNYKRNTNANARDEDKYFHRVVDNDENDDDRERDDGHHSLSKKDDVNAGDNIYHDISDYLVREIEGGQERTTGTPHHDTNKVKTPRKTSKSSSNINGMMKTPVGSSSSRETSRTRSRLRTSRKQEDIYYQGDGNDDGNDDGNNDGNDDGKDGLMRESNTGQPRRQGQGQEQERGQERGQGQGQQGHRRARWGINTNSYTIIPNTTVGMKQEWRTPRKGDISGTTTPRGKSIATPGSGRHNSSVGRLTTSVSRHRSMGRTTKSYGYLDSETDVDISRGQGQGHRSTGGLTPSSTASRRGGGVQVVPGGKQQHTLAYSDTEEGELLGSYQPVPLRPMTKPSSLDPSGVLPGTNGNNNSLEPCNNNNRNSLETSGVLPNTNAPTTTTGSNNYGDVYSQGSRPSQVHSLPNTSVSTHVDGNTTKVMNTREMTGPVNGKVPSTAIRSGHNTNNHTDDITQRNDVNDDVSDDVSDGVSASGRDQSDDSMTSHAHPLLRTSNIRRLKSRATYLQGSAVKQIDMLKELEDMLESVKHSPRHHSTNNQTSNTSLYTNQPTKHHHHPLTPPSPRLVNDASSTSLSKPPLPPLDLSTQPIPPSSVSSSSSSSQPSSSSSSVIPLESSPVQTPRTSSAVYLPHPVSRDSNNISNSNNRSSNRNNSLHHQQQTTSFAFDTLNTSTITQPSNKPKELSVSSSTSLSTTTQPSSIPLPLPTPSPSPSPSQSLLVNPEGVDAILLAARQALNKFRSYQGNEIRNQTTSTSSSSSLPLEGLYV